MWWLLSVIKADVQNVSCVPYMVLYRLSLSILLSTLVLGLMQTWAPIVKVPAVSWFPFPQHVVVVCVQNA